MGDGEAKLLADLHVHRADLVDCRANGLASLQRADAGGRAGEDHVPWVKRENLGRAFDQFRNANDQVARVSILLHFAVDGETQSKRAGIADLVGGDKPRAKHGVAVG